MKLNEKAPGGKYEDLPLEEQTVDELLALKDRNLGDISKIQVQLANSKRRFKEDGVSGDFGWYIRAKAAVKAKGRFDQQIQQELGRRKRIEKQANIERSNDENYWFRKAAHHYLSGADFDAIVDLAIQMERERGK